MAYLIVRTSDNREVSRHALEASSILGRAAECDIPLHDPHLSRLHCRLDPDPADGSWTLVDLNSRNGTILHNQKIDQHLLRDADTFQIAGLHITFHTGPLPRQRPKDPLSSPPAAPPPPPAPSSDETLSDTHTPSDVPSSNAPLAFQRPPASPRISPAGSSPTTRQVPRVSRYALPLLVLIMGLAATIALYWYLFTH